MRMSDPRTFEVVPVVEARAGLSSTLASFRADGEEARPVVIGRQRRPEAAIVPWSMFIDMLDLYEDEVANRRLVHAVADRLDTPPAEFISLDELGGVDGFGASIEAEYQASRRQTG